MSSERRRPGRAARALLAGVAFGAGACLAVGGAMAQAGPSFDCAKARGPVETAICADPTLAAADWGLVDVYLRLRRGLGETDLAALRKDQLAWLATRNACGTRPAGDIGACVGAAIRARTTALAARLAPSSPAAVQPAPAGSPPPAKPGPVAAPKPPDPPPAALLTSPPRPAPPLAAGAWVPREGACALRRGDAEGRRLEWSRDAPGGADAVVFHAAATDPRLIERGDRVAFAVGPERFRAIAQPEGPGRIAVDPRDAERLTTAMTRGGRLQAIRMIDILLEVPLDGFAAAAAAIAARCGPLIRPRPAR